MTASFPLLYNPGIFVSDYQPKVSWHISTLNLSTKLNPPIPPIFAYARYAISFGEEGHPLRALLIFPQETIIPLLSIMPCVAEKCNIAKNGCEKHNRVTTEVNSLALVPSRRK